MGGQLGTGRCADGACPRVRPPLCKWICLAAPSNNNCAEGVEFGPGVTEAGCEDLRKAHFNASDVYGKEKFCGLSNGTVASHLSTGPDCGKSGLFLKVIHRIWPALRLAACYIMCALQVSGTRT